MSKFGFRLLFILSMFSCIGFSQGWVPVKDGFASKQNVYNPFEFQLRFKANGPLGKNWMYGSYLDQDSLQRVIAYREGGAWVSLPFHFDQPSMAADIGMYGDTLYIVGSFWGLYDEKSGLTLPTTNVIKWFEDSLWVNDPLTLYMGENSSLSSKGDTIIMSGASYYNPPQVIYRLFMRVHGGTSWQYPFSTVHPTSSKPDFGALIRFQILKNGDVLIINNLSPTNTSYNGVIRWDGQQWHSYGNGIRSLSGAGDFEFYNGDLYMSGNFSRDLHPDDPGQLIARWDGTQWKNVGGGLKGYTAVDLFVNNGVLYCTNHSLNYSDTNIYFGDANIPYIAGWDGQQWCGTPIYLPIPPSSFGIINDTLYAAFQLESGIINGDSSVYLMYFDGDYLHGPNAICSTLGIGVGETSTQEGRISVYPNPASEALNISLPKADPNARVSLYNLSGQLVMEQSLPVVQGQVKLPHALHGLYLVVVESAGQVFTEKVLVENN